MFRPYDHHHAAHSLQQKWVPETFLGSKARPARKADKLAAIYEQVM
jgi:hypothetical protein